MEKKAFARIFSRIKKNYPDSKIRLNYDTEFELLVAVMLSAQCTDVAVNKVTPAVFAKYKTVTDYAVVSCDELAADIKGVGLYKNKAKNIIASANIIINDFKGVLPHNMEDMLVLPGVARKTANVVLSNIGVKPSGIAVDTHVLRISARLGFSQSITPVAVEKDLMLLVDEKDWGVFSYYIIEHGRALCRARHPLCGDCFLQKNCCFFKHNKT